MSTNKRNNVVFIGNIPFDQSEEALKEIFGQVGPIVSFRLIFDHDTNRPKGFAFCEYPDVATAATAVRNLNGYDIGTRQLRVDFSEKEGTGGRGQKDNSDSRTNNLLPPLPEGRAPPVGVTIPGAISQTLQAYPPQQLADIISQLKAVATSNPEQAKQLLTSSPQLAYATFQAMLMMNLVDPSVLQQVVASTGQASQPPPAAQPMYQQPPPVAPPPAAYPPATYPAPQKMELVRQVMSLTEDQISNLPPEQRGQILLLRQQIAAGQI